MWNIDYLGNKSQWEISCCKAHSVGLVRSDMMTRGALMAPYAGHPLPENLDG